MQPMTNPDSAPSDGLLLGVNEVFETIQGEATFTGTPAIFVRLQGCDVGCPWCDTVHTWSMDRANVRSLKEVAFDKKGDGASWAEASIPSLLAVLATFRARHVVITGGEPALWDLRPLSSALLNAGKTVQLETSGTAEIRIDDRAFVTLSPKIGMPGGKMIRGDAMMLADEIKMPVGKQADVEKLLDFLRVSPTLTSRRPGRPARSIWLQPLSTSAKATAICIEAATVHGWRLSIQAHKFIGVR